MQIKEISSRQNPFVKNLYQLAHTSTAHQKNKVVWIEGENLCKAYLSKGGVPRYAVCSKTVHHQGNFFAILPQDVLLYVLEDSIFEQVSTLHSANGLGFVIPLPDSNAIDGAAPSIVLDRVQDPGNVGSILRSAAAFGFKQVIALQGTSSLWNAKTIRAGMGAHFSLNIIEKVDVETLLSTLKVPMLSTSSHSTNNLHQTQLPWPCCWVLGNEGQGVDAVLIEHSKLSLRIEQPGGEESLNAAIAASICMYETVRQMSAK